MEPLDDKSFEVIRVLDRMTEAGWITRIAGNNDVAKITWTRTGINCLNLLRGIMLDTLHLEPHDMRAFFFVIDDSTWAGGLPKNDKNDDTLPPSRI